jgi:hypothetical protein
MKFKKQSNEVAIDSIVEHVLVALKPKLAELNNEEQEKVVSALRSYVAQMVNNGIMPLADVASRLTGKNKDELVIQASNAVNNRD